MNRQKITIEEVKHVATLAHLELKEEELKKFSSELNDILTYISKIEQLDLADIPPTPYVVPLKCPLKQDEKIIFEKKDELLSNVPEIEGSFFKVPKIIE